MDGMICRPMSRWFQRSWRSRTQPLSDGFHSRSLACQCPHSPRSPGMDPTWYAVGMAPKVAELRSLASDDKRRRSPQIDSQHCANLASPYPIANRSLSCATLPERCGPASTTPRSLRGICFRPHPLPCNLLLELLRSIRQSWPNTYPRRG
jgi:hypothetical protein